MANSTADKDNPFDLNAIISINDKKNMVPKMPVKTRQQYDMQLQYIIKEYENKDLINYHKTIKELCKNAYLNSPLNPEQKEVRNWKELKQHAFMSKKTYFSARVYKNGNHIVISLKVPILKGVINDFLVHFQKGYGIPQFKEAMNYVKDIRKVFPKEEITITGYQLGGSAAQFIGIYNKDIKIVTFDALGIGRIYSQFGENRCKLPNVINYISSTEPKSFRKSHIGEVRLVYVSEYQASANQDFGNIISRNEEPQKKEFLADFNNLESFKTGCNSKA